MKIAFTPRIFSTQEYGGVSRYFCNLAKSLFKHPDLEIKIFAQLYINDYISYLPQELVFGYKILEIPKMQNLIHAINQISLRPALNRFRPDIVHDTYYSPSPYAPSSAYRVATVYDMIHEHFPVHFSKHDPTSEWKRAITQRADHVICISETTRNDLVERFKLPENKISVIYLGIDRMICSNLTDSTNSKPYLLYVGSRNGYKNFSGFLSAFSSSHWLSSNFNVVCFGGGAFSEAEVEFFKKLRLSVSQIIHCNGNDTKLADRYLNAALFVYPSLYEGFGLPPPEAMSLGCPVACSNTSSIPEVVGNAGEYFDPQDVSSIRHALECVLSSTQRKAELIEEGRLRCNQFSWERCAMETKAVYVGLK